MAEEPEITEEERQKRIRGALAVIAIFGGLAGFMIMVANIFASGKI